MSKLTGEQTSTDLENPNEDRTIQSGMSLDSKGINSTVDNYRQQLATDKRKQEPLNKQISHQPAEFEKQAAIWLTWPSFEYVQGQSNKNVVLEIIKNVLQHSDCKVKLVAPNKEAIKEINSAVAKFIKENNLDRELFKNGRYLIYSIDTPDMWTRDIGPSFVVTKDGKLAVANPSFNDWGYSNLNSKAGLKAEQNFDINASKYFARMPIFGSKMNYEGGATIVNGSGVLITTESVMLNRNPKLTKTQIEEEFKKTLGANKVIWLEQGVVEDDHSFKGRIKLADGKMVYTALTTGGHIDDFARFADASTILLAEVDKSELEKNDPVAIENNRRLEKSFKILSEAKDQNGNPFKIVRVPMPKQMVATIQPCINKRS